jgi:small subunit ribosomal protein S16
MLRIRLRRVGRKKAPSYRVVVADSRAPRDGKYIEMLGVYDPKTEPATFDVNAEKVREWMRKGAQPSESVERLLRSAGVLDNEGQKAASTAS